MENKQEWTKIIRSEDSFFKLNLKEVLEYKDLIFLLTKKNFTTMYKQTILGPLWIVINPLLTTTMFTIIFGYIASIPTDSVPQFIFYMAGNIIWVYFSACLSQISSTFLTNAAIFGKVYFPRLVLPISVIFTKLIDFTVQLAIFVLFIILFKYKGANIAVDTRVVLFPLLIVQVAALALGVGVIISSLTTKYRDLNVLVGFGLQLWMYATPIVYPSSQIGGKLYTLLMLNPMAPIVETFRYLFLGCGEISVKFLIISVVETIVVATIGIFLFKKVEKDFIDTV
ncbi:MAG: ABC transporter permease [Intestinibacter sp.]|uniref:ABC transporter permease n=1 Tax=Intestinibacter sp. TaxID=1965304 RepID=UPI002A8285FE|nr:ABC transporter permease [Intestinibacter sp.]MDY4573477.1 ABC transporter permease [Intestinibacter sp.]